MGRHPVGPQAAALPWIAPAAPALFALTEEFPPAERLACDPGMLLLVLRYLRPSPTPTTCLSPSNYDQPILLDASACHLEQSPNSGWLNSSCPPVGRLLEAARAIATHAQNLAIRTHLCPPSAAWVTGLLAPLGLFAIAAIDPAQLTSSGKQPLDAISRRLCSRWRLPQWFAHIVGSLTHSTADAVTLGADKGLFSVVRAAIAIAELQGYSFGLLGNSGTRDVEHLLPGPGEDPGADVLANRLRPWEESENPAEIRLLPQALRIAARARRAQPGQSDLADQIDRLHELLAQQRQEFDSAVSEAKLSALAEFAAGAGHEINNPLAIISGNAQLLRGQELSTDRQARLDVIIRQTRRISELLLDLRQFARPSKPRQTLFLLPDLMQEVLSETGSLASSHDVRIVLKGQLLELNADRSQVKRAILEVLTNAIEASPTGAEVNVSVQTEADSAVICIDDHGAGLSKQAEIHLFDPFFSGHSAGRGRGLGLSTAWQFARLNGGAIHFDRLPGGGTRFTLRFPLADNQFVRESSRLSA